jgi:hypothetical protein
VRALSAIGATSGSIVTCQWQCGERSAGTRGSHPSVCVGGDGRRVEGRILDVVAHASDEALAHGLDVHQRAAVGQPELAVAGVGDTIAEVHELMWGTDVELDALEDGRDVVPREAERALHALGVDGARPQPLVDRHVTHRVRAVATQDLRYARPVLKMTGQHVFAREVHQRSSREIGQLERRAE